VVRPGRPVGAKSNPDTEDAWQCHREISLAERITMVEDSVRIAFPLIALLPVHGSPRWSMESEKIRAQRACLLFRVAAVFLFRAAPATLR
jgi:hypothetical protein